MFTGRTKVQVVLFVVIAAIAVTYAGARYAGLDRLFGARGYLVVARFADSGGIFTNAEVTYRGVAVGRVGQLRLVESGVEVELDIDSSAPPIPSDVRAVVVNRSAIGEQYVDLRPDRGEAPYLGNGSVIPPERTSVPPAVENILANVDGLVGSISMDSLRTVVDELNTAFAGIGPDLQRMLDAADSLTSAATEYLPQTKELIRDGRTVLTRQQQDAAELTALSVGLRQISEQLRASDPDLRALIARTTVVSQQVVDVLRTSGTDLGVVIANLLTTSDITTRRTAAIEQFLVAYPVVSAFTPSTSPDGTGHLGIMLNFFDPPPCLKGYEGTLQRTASEVGPAPVNRDAYCAEPPQSPIGVRGAQNAPVGGASGVEASPGLAGRSPAPDRRLPGALGLADTGRELGSFDQLLGLPG